MSFPNSMIVNRLLFRRRNCIWPSRFYRIPLSGQRLPYLQFTEVWPISSTVLFHSIRHPAWRVTSLPKFRFRQAPDLNVTSKYFRQVGCKFCVRSLKIVHSQLNYIYYLHNVCKRDRRTSGISFVFLIYFIEFSDDFGTWLKFALPALHFGNFEGCVTCYCRIEWKSAFLSWKLRR